MTPRKQQSKQPSKPPSKPPSKRPPGSRPTLTAKDLAALRVNAAQLATILGVSPSAISQAVEAGRLHRDTAGRFAMVKTVAGYCQALRERKPASGDEIRAELDYWRMRKIRQEVLDGRAAIAEEIGGKILAALRNACEQVQRACARYPGAVKAIRNLAAEIEAQASSQSLADLAEDTNPQPQPDNY